ncbi:MAG: efflux RND transporter periplasmic adaptor subunit [Syntrophomonadaceae bacterium]|jgi:HlyD family secretion protein
MKAAKKIYWIAGAAIILVMAIMLIKNSGTEVETVTIGRGQIQKTVVDTGYVQSASTFDLYSEQGGRVQEIAVAIGQKVSRGQVIMTLDNPDVAVQADQIRLQLAQAQAAATTAEASAAGIQLDLAKAQKDLQRAEQLLTAGVISQAEYEDKRLLVDKYRQSYQQELENLKAARQQVEINTTLLGNATQKQKHLTITSPVDGTVTQLPVKTAQVVSAGTCVARVAQTGNLEIRADILSDDLADVRVGQKVTITAPVLGDKTIAGRVSKIYPEAEEKQSALGVVQRRVPVVISLEDIANLIPGYETRVSIETTKKDNVLLIPREAVLTTPDNRQQIMLVINGRVHKKYIQTGIGDSKNLEIVRGLKEGERVIKDASLALKEKARVKVKQQ